MNLNDLIIKEQRQRPPRIILHGIHKIGKSTWAATAPKPLFILTEDGLGEIEVDQLPLINHVDEMFKALELIVEQDHDYKTIVIDTIDWFENIIWRKVCKDNNVTNIDEIGYHKGYRFAMKYWEIFFKKLDSIRNKGIAIILLAHNEIKSVNPPDSEPYDRYAIKLHKYPTTMCEEWADIILFANYVVYVNKEKNEKAGKAISSGERCIFTSPKPSYSAGSRFKLPEKIGMDHFDQLLNKLKKIERTNKED